MIKLSDILPIFKKHQIVFKEKYAESVDIHTFVFESKENLSWKAGQHGIFTINHVKIKMPTRAFSIASIPEERHIKISMKISSQPSAFKKALLDLKPGMSVSMRGPIGSLYPEKQKPLLFVAGGIGITPYRALIKQLILNSGEHLNEVNLLYLDSNKQFIYREELDEASRHSSISINYLTNREDISREISNFASNHQNEAEYYIVGSKSMIRSVRQMLKQLDVKNRNIKIDAFVGY